MLDMSPHKSATASRFAHIVASSTVSPRDIGATTSPKRSGLAKAGKVAQAAAVIFSRCHDKLWESVLVRLVTFNARARPALGQE